MRGAEVEEHLQRLCEWLRTAVELHHCVLKAGFFFRGNDVLNRSEIHLEAIFDGGFVVTCLYTRKRGKPILPFLH